MTAPVPTVVLFDLVVTLCSYLVFALANSDLEKRIVLGRPFEPLELKARTHAL